MVEVTTIMEWIDIYDGILGWRKYFLGFVK
jgi:hypothetical protein